MIWLDFVHAFAVLLYIATPDVLFDQGYYLDNDINKRKILLFYQFGNNWNVKLCTASYTHKFDDCA